MNSKLLLIILSALLLLPWAVTFLTSGETVGMYARNLHVLVEGDSDVYDCIWHVHWIRTAVKGGFDPRVYGNVSLAWHNMGWPDLFISLITGSNYNVMLLLGSLFSALAGYLLARSWGLGTIGSLLAGFIIAWMPVRVIRMYQHYPIASIGFLLMSMLFLRKWVVEKGRSNLIFLVMFSALAVMESLYHGITIALGWLITSFVLGKKYAKRSLFAGVLAGTGCIIGSLWILSAPGAFGQNPGKDWKEAVFWAAEPQSYFLPSFLGNPLVLDYMPNHFEGIVTPGASVAILALFYCWKKRSWRALIAVLAVITLTMGPLFKLNGVPTPVPLPYLLLVKLPWLSAARAPSRLAILTGIMAALAAGAFIEKRKPRTGWLLAGIILIEIVPLKLNTIPVTTPHFYSTEAAAGLTLEIPSSDRIRMYSLFSIADNSPRIVKFLARGDELGLESVPLSLRWGSSIPPDFEALEMTGAETIVYNRWMFTDSIRGCYDLLYKDIFPEYSAQDSVWVWKLK